MKSGVRDIEWRGIPVAALAVAATAIFVREGVWPIAATTAGLGVIASAAVVVQGLKIRAILLGLMAMLTLAPALYFLVMLPQLGVVVAAASALAAWGAVRAAVGRRSVPHPLAR